tara:strand:- start:806 stop:1018 length:213 start_codon:yes stop_codon:yes gene_type:complete
LNSNSIIFTSVDDSSFSLTKILRLFLIFTGTDRSNLILLTIISESELTELNEQPRIAMFRKIRVARLRNL